MDTLLAICFLTCRNMSRVRSPFSISPFCPCFVWLFYLMADWVLGKFISFFRAFLARDRLSARKTRNALLILGLEIFFVGAGDPVLFVSPTPERWQAAWAPAPAGLELGSFQTRDEHTYWDWLAPGGTRKSYAYTWAMIDVFWRFNSHSFSQNEKIISENSTWRRF